ncbi:hypothetical protein HET69_14230 [Streptomyces sp. CJ_13]|uniref:hypothetical protein n=1 Tax=Streptomyces sp. CJ_13 TaxID=2724943 RepID=UPI001BDBC9B5|nr:hypothetical protein [Streptomyces sp. CJ_13]MBT1185138.1 hypothetical protein [Streptomyces sp. CJ_13]
MITALDAAAAVQLEASIATLFPARGGRAGTRFLVICDCAPPRRIQISPFTFGQGSLLCGLCLARFRPAETPLPRQPSGEEA